MGGISVRAISSGCEFEPIINSVSAALHSADSVKDIMFTGEFFHPDMNIRLSSGVVNSFTFVTQNEITLNISFGSTIGQIDIIIDGVVYPGFLEVIEVIGTGEAGVYTEDFSSGFGSWEVVDLNNQDIKPFTLLSSNTPSSNTGPDTTTPFAYVETSGPLLPNRATLTTSNFREAINITWDQHLYGADTGTFELQITIDGINWETIYSVTGQVQVQGLDPFQQVSVDLTPHSMSAIRFHYFGWASFRGDAAITNISITSI